MRYKTPVQSNVNTGRVPPPLAPAQLPPVETAAIACREGVSPWRVPAPTSEGCPSVPLLMLLGPGLLYEEHKLA
jgi:hypothetical protein